MTTTGTRQLTYAQAAARVGRSERVIRLWRRDGMDMGWATIDGQRTRVVREDVLLAWFRQKLQSSPVQYYRRRRMARDAGLPDPTPPASLQRCERPARPLVPAEAETAESGHTEVETGTPARGVDPLADMKPMRGGPEYRALMAALRGVETGCRDVEAFTADRVDTEELVVLARICAACPVLEPCRTYAAVARPSVGVWAGAPALQRPTAA